MSILLRGKTEFSKELLEALSRENLSLDKLLYKLRNHREYPAFAVKLDPFSVRWMKKPIKVRFIFYADEDSWRNYKD